MQNWKCTNCGYDLAADAPPDKCPSCGAACEFVDNSCYIPDCEGKNTDDRIGPSGKH